MVATTMKYQEGKSILFIAFRIPNSSFAIVFALGISRQKWAGTFVATVAVLLSSASIVLSKLHARSSVTMAAW